MADSDEVSNHLLASLRRLIQAGVEEAGVEDAWRVLKLVFCLLRRLGLEPEGPEIVADYR